MLVTLEGPLVSCHYIIGCHLARLRPLDIEADQWIEVGHHTKIAQSGLEAVVLPLPMLSLMPVFLRIVQRLCFDVHGRPAFDEETTLLHFCSLLPVCLMPFLGQQRSMAIEIATIGGCHSRWFSFFGGSIKCEHHLLGLQLTATTTSLIMRYLFDHTWLFARMLRNQLLLILLQLQLKTQVGTNVGSDLAYEFQCIGKH